LKTCTPRQRIKVCFGLRGSDRNCGLTLIQDNPLLMEMDAPVVIPAGSMLRKEYADGGYAFPKESVTLRGDA